MDTTSSNSRPSSIIRSGNIQDDDEEDVGHEDEEDVGDEDDEDTLSVSEDTLSHESMSSDLSNVHKDLSMNKESEMNLFTKSPLLMSKPGQEALKSMTTIMDTNTLEDMITLGGKDEFSCGFMDDSFYEDTLSPSPRDNCSSFSAIKDSLNSFESFKEDDFIAKELKNLFSYVEKFKPQDVVIGMSLKPFLPDYIPALGSVDEFIKVPRPDGQPNNLGLKVLDEDGPKQSDPAVLTLHLHSTCMKSNFQPFQVASIENADKNPKKLDSWISSIKDLHRSKPPPSLLFSKPMPDIEKLKEIWPPQLDKILEEIDLPSAKLEVDLATFINIYCSIFDIPVYQNKIESLHILFMLYLDLKSQSQETSLSRYWLHA